MSNDYLSPVLEITVSSTEICVLILGKSVVLSVRTLLQIALIVMV